MVLVVVTGHVRKTAAPGVVAHEPRHPAAAVRPLDNKPHSDNIQNRHSHQFDHYLAVFQNQIYDANNTNDQLATHLYLHNTVSLQKFDILDNLKIFMLTGDNQESFVLTGNMAVLQSAVRSGAKAPRGLP